MDDVAAVVVDLRVGNLDAFNEEPGVVDGEGALTVATLRQRLREAAGILMVGLAASSEYG